MPLPTITMIGNVVADPELRFTQSGKPVVNFRVAANERRKNEAGEWIDGDSVFLDVTSWRSPEQINTECLKGTRVIVVGQLRQREYEKDGEKRKAFEITADYVATQLVDGSNPRTVTNTDAQADPWAASAPTAADETPV
jgi:single-strand DNA-binding protein